MKKIVLVTVLFSIVLTSCNDTKKKVVEPTAKEQEKEKTAHEENTINNDWIHDIALDNNAKWNANIETTQGVNAMLKLIEERTPETIEDYHFLATKLSDVKNTVVKECTMKGPSHDNLHIFLHPLIEKIDYLLEITSTEEGAEITASIKENLAAYEHYFQ